MKFSRREYWSGSSFPPPGDFPDPGIKPTSPAFLARPGGFFTTATAGKSHAWDWCPNKRDSGELLHFFWPCKGTKRSWGLPNWGITPGLLRFRWIFYHLSHQGNPQREAGNLQPRRAFLPEPNHAGTLISDFNSPGIWERNFCWLSTIHFMVFCCSSTNMGKQAYQRSFLIID